MIATHLLVLLDMMTEIDSAETGKEIVIAITNAIGTVILSVETSGDKVGIGKDRSAQGLGHLPSQGTMKIK